MYGVTTNRRLSLIIPVDANVGTAAYKSRSRQKISKAPDDVVTKTHAFRYRGEEEEEEEEEGKGATIDPINRDL